MPLEKTIGQDSFRSGMWRGVARHLIPVDGAYDLLNYLLDDEDGSPYKRGGSAWMTADAPGAGGSLNGVLGLWDGRTVAGDRTIMMYGNTGISVPGVVPADDASAPVGYFGTTGTDQTPKFTEHDGVVVVTGHDAAEFGHFVYAGSRKASNYSTGTVAVTNASKVVTGTGTAWLANVDVGMVLALTGSQGRWGVVESVDSDTQVTLRYPWGGATAATLAYSLQPFAALNATAAGPVACAEFVAGRLCGVPRNKPNRMVFSHFQADGSPDYGMGSAGGTYPDTDHHGFQGRLLGINALRDTALVFTTAGLFAVRNMSLDLTDDFGNVQQTVDHIDGMVLWSQQGPRPWGNGLVIPSRDGIYLVDGVSQPLLLSRSISELYRSYVSSGYRPGQASIFRDTYLLPIVNGDTVVGWLTCKLDGSDDSRAWPCTRLSAGAMRCAVVRNRIDSAPRLLGGSAQGNGAKLASLSWFDPAAANKNDADATAPTFTLETRDYPTGTGQVNTVRKARVAYTLVDAASDNPQFSFSYAKEDGSYTTHADGAVESAEGSDTWLFNRAGRFIRFKLTCATAAATGSIKSIEAWTRPRNRD